MNDWPSFGFLKKYGLFIWKVTIEQYFDVHNLKSFKESWLYQSLNLLTALYFEHPNKRKYSLEFFEKISLFAISYVINENSTCSFINLLVWTSRFIPNCSFNIASSFFREFRLQSTYFKSRVENCGLFKIPNMEGE